MSTSDYLRSNFSFIQALSLALVSCGIDMIKTGLTCLAIPSREKIRTQTRVAVLLIK